MKNILMSLLVAMVCIGCSKKSKVSESLGAPQNAGITGQVTVTNSPLIADLNVQPTTQGFQTSILVLNDDNNVIATITSSRNGEFKITLPSGTYILVPQADPLTGPVPTQERVLVNVFDNQYADVTLTYRSIHY
jgi:hypothetical protein